MTLTGFVKNAFIALYTFSTTKQLERHPFKGLFSKTTWVSWHRKRKINLDFNEARDDGVVVASAGPYANHLHLTPDR